MEIIVGIQVCPIWWMNFDSNENYRKKKAFFWNQNIDMVYSNKENVFIVPMTKKMKIIMRILVCPIWGMNFDSKENGGRKRFSWQTKAWISFNPKRRKRLWWLITEKKRLLCETMFVEIDQRTLFLKIVEREVFLGKPKHRFIYPNEENDFVVPNH